MSDQVQSVTSSGAPMLSRSMSLWHVTLYGLGVTIAAEIYVLIGAAAARAGMQAPLAFVAAAGSSLRCANHRAIARAGGASERHGCAKRTGECDAAGGICIHRVRRTCQCGGRSP